MPEIVFVVSSEANCFTASNVSNALPEFMGFLA